ncbi:MAG: Mur ligase family protein, partial [Candidatus Acidiferrales bacterium]
MNLKSRNEGEVLIESEMNLKELFSGAEIGAVNGAVDADIRTVAYDSRKVAPGTLFFALQGEKEDGNRYVPDALKRGAIAIASERARPVGMAENVAWVEILPGAQRRVLAVVSAKFYGQPANALQLVGVTGTNGKTTTTYLVDSILRAAGKKTGLIGTIGYRTPRASRDAINTTPESLDLQQMFAEIRDESGSAVVMETSSHALAMDRLWGCHFAVAVFTNLTRDHLADHNTFEEYFAAKRRLFEGTGAGPADVAI